MRYLDVCAGISASTVAWKPLGWEAVAYSEIEAAPRAVLAHHYPDTPLHGDFTTIRGDEYGAIDLLVGGTPCQDFSVAGLRAGLDGDRGNLSLEFLRLADRTRPRWVVWENVPGVLSIDGGRAFGAILGGLGELGYGFAYRVLDAKYFGVPQQRRRVFIVACRGDWRGAGAVLVERNGMSGRPAPFWGQVEGNSYGFASASGGGLAKPLGAHALSKGRGTDLDNTTYVEVVAFHENQQGAVWESDTVQALNRGGGKPGQGYAAIRQGSRVRRMTPRECERLQGFPDDYTLVPHRGKPMADGPRYKALGNSMAVPVMRWIGERITQVEALRTEQRVAA